MKQKNIWTMHPFNDSPKVSLSLSIWERQNKHIISHGWRSSSKAHLFGNLWWLPLWFEVEEKTGDMSLWWMTLSGEEETLEPPAHHCRTSGVKQLSHPEPLTHYLSTTQYIISLWGWSDQIWSWSNMFIQNHNRCCAVKRFKLAFVYLNFISNKDRPTFETTIEITERLNSKKNGKEYCPVWAVRQCSHINLCFPWEVTLAER